MTTIEDPFVYTETDNYRENREWFDEHHPALPPAAELAQPIIDAFISLFDAFEPDCLDGIAFGIEQGEFHPEAEQHIATAHEVAALVAVTVRGMTMPTDGSTVFGEAARSIVLAICRTPSLETSLT